MLQSSGRKKPNHHVVLDTLRLSESQWRRCVDQLDEDEAQKTESVDQRQHKRLPHRDVAYLLMALVHPDGREQHFKVWTHDISRSGLGFLHGTYIHIDRKVCILLKHRSDGWVPLEAEVRRCDYVQDGIYQVGVEFDSLIDTDDFLFSNER